METAKGPPHADEGAEGAEGASRSNFIREIIDADLAQGRHGGQVVTRFPPEPNGYLHIGHAKAIYVDFQTAADYGGRCHLRFDDTNPTSEETEYVEAIKRDVRWLGYDWGEHLYFASDCFEQMYDYAVDLIRKGKAYVCSLSREAFSEHHRGTIFAPGVASPYRERTVEENLDLFARMRAGEFAEGEHVLRAKIDMASPNMLMRDPPLYRIMHAHHHRTGDRWCIYPMYDYAHCLEDALEGVTHSICTLEFETNRELYDWVIENVESPHRPRQYEFARLNLAYTMTSKRKLLQLVKEGVVEGWDDPRMPTVAGLRRRGVTPEAIRALCEMTGVTKTNRLVDIEKFDYCIRDDLNHRAPRVMCVQDPLKVIITTWPEERVEELDASYWPHDVPKEGSRPVPFTRELYIERDDFAEEPPAGWHRLAPGGEVRLRWGYVIRCDEVVKDEAGEVVALRCSHDAATRGGDDPVGRKVKGTIHWVSAPRSIPVTLRLYDRLFTAEQPGVEADFLDQLNPDSLVEVEGRAEPSLAALGPGEHVQFERRGYFFTDPIDARPGAPVFNRVVTLRDSWAKKQADASPAESMEEARARKARRKATQAANAPQTTISDEREAARAADPALAARFARYTDALGLSAEDADVLTGERALSALFEAALERHDSPQSVANWLIHVLLGELRARDLDVADLPVSGQSLGALVALVDGDAISSSAGQTVLAALLERGGGDPAALVDALGLRQLSDADALAQVIDQVIADHPEPVARYREGKRQLLGFFIGQVMRASGGKANPQLTRELLTARLAGG